MRTAEEVLARIEGVDPAEDLFGAVRSDLISALPFEQAKPWLKDGATGDDWEPRLPLVAMRDYLPFAFGKAIDHRGLSAGRSVDHLSAWSWLIGDDCYRYVIELPGYPMYGMPHLWAACQWLGLDPKSLVGEEDWEAASRMAVGQPCEPDCDAGCIC